MYVQVNVFLFQRLENGIILVETFPEESWGYPYFVENNLFTEFLSLTTLLPYFLSHFPFMPSVFLTGRLISLDVEKRSRKLSAGRKAGSEREREGVV